MSHLSPQIALVSRVIRSPAGSADSIHLPVGLSLPSRILFIIWMSFRTLSLSCVYCPHVGSASENVNSHCYGLKMMKINTHGIEAKMIKGQFLRKMPPGQFPRHLIGENHSFALAISKATVALFVGFSLPNPAAILSVRGIYFRPEKQANGYLERAERMACRSLTLIVQSTQSFTVMRSSAVFYRTELHAPILPYGNSILKLIYAHLAQRLMGMLAGAR